MQELERKKLQHRYAEILQSVNKLSEGLAAYYATQADEQQMLTHVQWYDRMHAEQAIHKKARQSGY